MSERQKKNRPKYRIARRCPQGLPKVHGGQEWLKLINDPQSPVFLEGVVIGDGKVCVLKYCGRGAVIALPFEYLPDASFEKDLCNEDRDRLKAWREAYSAGEYDAALRERQAGSTTSAF